MGAASEALPVREGDIVGDKYRLLQVLGRGGMAVVMQAEHIQLHHHVALKFLRPNLCRDAEAVARFLREGRSAVQIQSEHVARVLDVGVVEAGVPYLAMEFLQGSDLARMVKARGPLPAAEAADYLLQAMEAVAEAHALGIVHRDLKPQNLFLVQRRDGTPVVKVLDFGISKAIDSPDAGVPRLTATATMLGSPRYMPPEQLASSHDVDRRADIWGLGTILYELLTGRPAFDGETAAVLSAAIMRDPPARPRMLRSDIPRGLETVVLRCLEKDPDKRYQNVAFLAEAVAPFAPKLARVSAERIARLLSVAGGLPAPAAPVEDEANVATVPKANATPLQWAGMPARGAAGGGSARRRNGLLAVAATALVAGGVGAWLALGPASQHAAGGASADSAVPTAPPTASTNGDAKTMATGSAEPSGGASAEPSGGASAEPSGGASAEPAVPPTGARPSGANPPEKPPPASSSGKRKLPKYGGRE